MSTKRHTSKYLTQEAIELIHRLALKMGISQNGVVEVAIRDLARKQNVESGEDRKS